MNRGMLFGGALLTGVLAYSLSAQTPPIDDFEVSVPSPGARMASAGELAARKAYVEQLEQLTKKLKSRHDTGLIEAQSLLPVQTALEIALAELAAAENKPREMAEHYAKAAAAADDLVKSAQASYDAGRVDLDALLTALKTQAQLKVTLASLRR
ncbi:MAG: hypothetical protein U0836_06545 [Pirellulales bacterium]